MAILQCIDIFLHLVMTIRSKWYFPTYWMVISKVISTKARQLGCICKQYNTLNGCECFFWQCPWTTGTLSLKVASSLPCFSPISSAENRDEIMAYESQQNWAAYMEFPEQMSVQTAIMYLHLWRQFGNSIQREKLFFKKKNNNPVKVAAVMSKRQK